MTDGDSEAEELRDSLPHDVYAARADYVTLAVNKTNAGRLVGWLREYAEYAEVSGADKTADHARHFADGLAAELPDEEPVGGGGE